MQQDDLPSEICREEDCDIEGIHEPHEVQAKEQPPRSKREREAWRLKREREPWKLMNSPEALDEAIMRVINQLNVASFQAIFHGVENDFGSLSERANSGDRTLHRHLVSLCRAGRLLRVDVGQRVFAYLKPSSKFARDVDFVRNVLDNWFDDGKGRLCPVHGGRTVSPRRMI